jgi:hypothetical protein
MNFPGADMAADINNPFCALAGYSGSRLEIT